VHERGLRKSASIFLHFYKSAQNLDEKYKFQNLVEEKCSKSG